MTRGTSGGPQARPSPARRACLAASRKMGIAWAVHGLRDPSVLWKTLEEHMEGHAGKRKAALDPDEALALRLHEEMNGPTSNADGGRRALRARPQLGGKRARELRAASRNNSTSNLS